MSFVKYGTIIGFTQVTELPTTISGYGITDAVPSGRTLTINGTTFDLSANRTFTVGSVTSVALSVPTGLTISGSPITSSGTLAITLTSGYSIPTTASQTNWDTAYTNRITSLTTTGTSGAATLIGNVLNIPQYAGGGGGGTVTSVASGNGMNFTTITSSGSVTLGTPSSTTLSSTNAVTATSHTHAFAPGGTVSQYISGAGTLITFPTLTNGTVTSVAALTLGTTGTDLSSSVANSTTTPVITLNVPTASATNRGVLSSANWSTFNSKESALTFSSPLSRSVNTISIPVATTSVNGYLSSTDWTTFNSKQAALNGTGFVKATGTTISYDNNTYYLASNPNGYTTNTGTVTSVAALTIGTTGTDVSSTVANSTTTPVITLNIPDASATARGLMTTGIQAFAGSKTFNATVTLSAFGARFTEVGSLSSPPVGIGQLYAKTDKKIYYKNSDGTDYDLTSGSGGTVTSVGLSSATSGVTIGSTPITTSGTITLAIATASGSQQGLLSSTDWTTFNSKYNLPSLTSGSVLFSNGTTIAQDNANFFWDDTNNRLGIGTSPSAKLHIGESGAAAQLWLQRTDGYNPIKLIGGTLADGNGFKITMNTTDAFAITSGGNAGLGVTPSAWGTGYLALQLSGQGESIFANKTISALGIASNGYYNGTNWIYNNSDLAGQYQIVGNSHQWYIAPSGTAGNPITFTQAMTLTANNRLLINQTGDTGEQLQVNGTGKFGGSVTTLGTTVQIRDASTNNGARVLFLGSSTAKNFLVGNQWTVSDTFEITPSTTNGGSTFTTPALSIAGSGAATFSGDVLTNSTYNITSGLKLWGNHITTEWFNGVDAVNVNYRGYNSGLTQFRNFDIYDGKQNIVASFNGSTKAATFSSTLQAAGEITTGSVSRAFIRQTVGGDAELGCKSGGVTSIWSDGATRLSFGVGGAATFSSTLGINGVADSVKSGTYTPTLTNITNVTTSSVNTDNLKYIRVGSIVYVSGWIAIQCTTANTLTIVEITLPISSNFTSTEDATGGAMAYTQVCGRIRSNATSDRAEVNVYPSNNTSLFIYALEFSYIIK